MRAISTPTSTTFQVTTPADFSTALDLMHEDALGLFDRDIASKVDLPDEGARIDVQINARPTVTGDGHRITYFVAGWIFVRNTGFVYELAINELQPERSQWNRAHHIRILDVRHQGIDRP